MQIYVVLHGRSVPYLRGNIAFLQATLEERFGREIPIITVPNSVDDALIDGPATVYVIGEKLGAFTRRPRTKYLFVNYSVVTLLGNPLATSYRGLRRILRVRRMLEAKLHCFDALLDYYPAQTRVLRRKFNMPVIGFLPCSPPVADNIRAGEKRYDVCFVGGVSKRRRYILDSLREMGLRLSPTSGGDLEDFAALSRCTLNLHMYGSNHLETPRIVGSLSAGTPVVSEKSYGFGDLKIDNAVIEVRYRHIPHRVAQLLADREQLEKATSAAAVEFDKYHRRARVQMTLVAEQVEDVRIRGS